MTDKKYLIYYNKERNMYGHGTVDWFYRVELKYLIPVLFSDSINIIRISCKMLESNKENNV